MLERVTCSRGRILEELGSWGRKHDCMSATIYMKIYDLSIDFRKRQEAVIQVTWRRERRGNDLISLLLLVCCLLLSNDSLMDLRLEAFDSDLPILEKDSRSNSELILPPAVRLRLLYISCCRRLTWATAPTCPGDRQAPGCAGRDSIRQATVGSGP